MAVLSVFVPAMPRGDAIAAPKLVVLIVVDQMRADYVERFESQWRGGLRRLVTTGAWFRNAAYPYLATGTCAGHATIATGTFPHTHAIVNNAWWSRLDHRTVTCTEDAAVRNIGYGIAAAGGDSAHNLLVPTLADELRQQRGGHVVTLSLKDRAALMLAGREADAVTWLGPDLSGWITSSSFASAPVPAVQSFVDANPIDADHGMIWTRLLDAADYPDPDDGAGEAPPAGWTRTFPHAIIGVNAKPDKQSRAQWVRSPYADAYLSRFALSLVQSFALGHHVGTDFLGISFSTPDLVGHAFGPRSQEVRDIYAHLDRTLGDLFDALDRVVGRNEYVVALSSDHGVADIPEQASQAGRPGGRINTRALSDALEQRAEAVLGPGKYVAAFSGNDIYLEPGVYAQLRSTSGALIHVLAALTGHPGIARVLRAEQLTGRGVSSSDGELRAAATSYMSARSGDLVVITKPGWIMASTGTTHGSASLDDQRVPILLMGKGIKPGEYAMAVTPADIAPTLAALCGITMSKAEGHVLRAATDTTTSSNVGVAMSRVAVIPTARSQPHPGMNDRPGF